MNRPEKTQAPSRAFLKLSRCFLLPGICFCVACSHNAAPTVPATGEGSPVLTMMPVGEDSTDLAFLSSELKGYEKKTGVRIETLSAFDSVDGRLRVLQNLFAKRSAEPDICEIDDIWPGLLADDLIDLKPYLGDELTAIDKSLLDAFTVDGRLLALPVSVETAVLYYRTDLLKKYGYREPPQTWDELGRMAKVIQDGERKAGQKDFWGYIWQGIEGEALTCNAMEWQHAEGADLMDRAGTICADTPAAESALKRARSWVGTISPPSVIEYDEEDAANVWLAGSAAFARGWLSLYPLSKASPLLATRFSTAHLPAGKKGYAWVFGGNGLAVSRYSSNRKAAAQLVRYLISPEVQTRRLRLISSIPSRSNLLEDKTLLRDTALNGWLSQHWREGMFARPSAQSGKHYAALSNAYSNAVHAVLSGKEDPQETLTRLQAQLVAIMKAPSAPSTK
jgi:trehalose/maltose transport system substrate-binding protein